MMATYNEKKAWKGFSVADQIPFLRSDFIDSLSEFLRVRWALFF